MNRNEQHTQDFYYWEYRYRGWALFDYPVALEVPYVPFPNRNIGYGAGYDDGKTPSLLTKVSSLFSQKQEKEKVEPLPYAEPPKIEQRSDLWVYILSFQKATESDVAVFRELLTTLSFTHNPVSCEIIATGDSIDFQIVCHEYDKGRVRSHIEAYLPFCVLKDGEQFGLPFDREGSEIAVIDFGLQNETMLPLRMVERVDIDPLTSLFALFETLETGSCAVFQIMFRGINTPLSSDFMYAVSDGMGGSFFLDDQEILHETERKIKSPLLSVAVRLAVQGVNKHHTAYLANEGITSITTSTKSDVNTLIPLSNEGYNYDAHVMNTFYRTSFRHGMILSVNELVTLYHIPSRNIVSKKLYGNERKTKAIPSAFINQKYVLGVNSHNGSETELTLNDEQRLKHTHILGVTGVGKSTLITNMVLNDIKHGNGCSLFDPHGDIVEDVLSRIPESRMDDVILIDPSDTDYPVGFNLLSATSEAEKLVLSSDLVSAFREHSTSWGDTMTSVLSNAIDTFLNSNTGGTLIELKRFLIEDNFRTSFLQNVSDSSLHYYWKHEYGMVKKRISPLLTRIDTFLRPKIIKSMMVQRSGIDFSKAIKSKKIILFKLSIGLIGEENAYLLGSLFLSKLNQVALGRQSIPKEQRHPHYIYIDEFHHFMTPSINVMLSGVRKYGMGLILVHQSLSQIENPKTLSSIISNPFTRVCFRLGDADAKKLEDSFSFFERNDITSLEKGETIVRLGSSQNDCNMFTFPLSSEVNEERRANIIQYSREQYGTTKADIERLLQDLYPYKLNKPKKEPQERKQQETEHVTTPALQQTQEQTDSISQKDKDEIKERAERTETLRKHRKLQSTIKKLGQDFGFLSTIEKEIENGKRVDVSFEREDLNIACEISVTNTVNYEVSNINKCIDAGYDMVLLVSDSEQHRNNIQTKAEKEIAGETLKKVLFIQSTDIKQILKSCSENHRPQTEVIKGFRVKTEFEHEGGNEADMFKKDIERILKRKRK